MDKQGTERQLERPRVQPGPSGRRSTARWLAALLAAGGLVLLAHAMAPTAPRAGAQPTDPPGQLAYVWRGVWDLEAPRRLPTPNPTPGPTIDRLLPFDLAMADDGRLFVADAGSWRGWALSPDGGQVEAIAPEPPPAELDPARCYAGSRLTGLAMDQGGPGHLRPSALHLIWSCMSFAAQGHGQIRLRPATSLLETRPEGRIADRVVLSLRGATPMDMASVDPGTGQLVYPRGDALYWMRPDTGEQVRQSFDIPVPTGYKTKPAGIADPSQGRWALVSLLDWFQQRATLYRAGNGRLRDLDLSGMRPLAQTSLPDGRIFLLLRPKDDPAGGASDDPNLPLIKIFDAKGAPLASWTAAQLGSEHPPSTYWPWQIVASEAGFAFTSLRQNRFELAAFDSQGHARFRLLGGAWPASYDPLDGTGLSPDIESPMLSQALRLSVSPAGRRAVLELVAERLHRLDRDGASVDQLLAPKLGIDLAGDGALDFVSTADSHIYALEPGVDPRRVVPEDYPLMHDDLSGRIAAGGGRLFAAWPVAGRVAVLDPADPTVQDPTRQPRLIATLALTDTLGLWPADLAAGPAGELYTANLTQGRIERWSTALTPTLSSSFPAGFVHGPWRIAWGSLPDGGAGIAILTLDGAVELRALPGGALIARFFPETPDGLPLAAEDIGLDAEGRVLLAEVESRRIHRFEPAGPIPTPTTSPTPDPAATPSPTPERRCPISGDKRVTGPRRIVLGETTEIQLTLRADCPPGSQLAGADIAIVVDRSGSMAGGNYDALRQGVHALLQFVDTRYHRVALISFADKPSLDHPLTFDTAALYPVVDLIQPAGGTVVSGAITLADRHLRDAGRADALPVLILLSDGGFKDDPGAVAAAARGRGVQVFAVGYGGGINTQSMLKVAGLPSRYREAPSPSALVQVYRGLISEVQTSIAGSLIIEDQMGSQIDLVLGSSSPPALELGGALKWGLPILPRSGVTLTYRIRPRAVGIWPTNLWASADLRADGGIREHFDFPLPEIEVIAPTATPTSTATPSPTATATATASPTPTPAILYLPLLLREHCAPGTLPNDVVLVLDSSSSMLETGADGRSKMEAARQAIRQFLSLLDLGPGGIDRAAIISFDSQARLAQGLTADPSALDRALAAVVNASGTRLDLGIEAAGAELLGPARRAGAGRVLVLLTDGRANPVPIAVAEQRADEAKAAGILIYSIGLGIEVETEALQRIASRPENYFAAASPDDLDRIYQHIALSLPCAAEAFWGGR